MSSSRWYSSPPQMSQTPSVFGWLYVTWKTCEPSFRQMRRPHDALDHLVLGDLQVQNRVQLGALVLEHRVKGLGLSHVAGEAVEQEAVRGVRLGHAVLGHPDGDLVRHQLACVHVGAGLLAKVSALADVGAEEVARGDLRNRQVLGKVRSLRSLAGTGRPDEDDSHQRRNPS